MLLSKTSKGGPIGALAVEMNGQDGADKCALRPIQYRFDGLGVQVEGGGLDVGQHRGGAGPENRAGGGEKAERGGDDSVAGADAGGGQRQPEGIGAGGAAQCVGHAQLPGSGALKGGYLLAKDELLSLKDSPDRIQQFLVERAVLALEVQHGDGLGGLGGRPRRRAGVLHVAILPVAEGSVTRQVLSPPGLKNEICGSRLVAARRRKPAPDRGFGAPELKRFVNHYNVVTLRDLPVPGFPEPNPPISFFVHVQFGCIQTF